MTPVCGLILERPLSMLITFFHGTCTAYVLFVGKASHVCAFAFPPLQKAFHWPLLLSLHWSKQHILQTIYSFILFLFCDFLFTVRENKIIHNFQIFSCIFPSFLLLSLTIVEGDFSPTSNYVRYYSLSSTSSISQLSNSHSHQIYVQVGGTHLHTPHKFSLSIFF